MDKKYLDEFEKLLTDWNEVKDNLNAEGKEDYWPSMSEEIRSKIIYKGITEGIRINLETQKRAANILIRAERIAYLALVIAGISLGASIISIVANVF